MIDYFSGLDLSQILELIYDFFNGFNYFFYIIFKNEIIELLVERRVDLTILKKLVTSEVHKVLLLTRCFDIDQYRHHLIINIFYF